jgi:hypothetical protein
MDEDQLQAYQLALSGHNLLILGQAGHNPRKIVKVSPVLFTSVSQTFDDFCRQKCFNSPCLATQSKLVCLKLVFVHFSSVIYGFTRLHMWFLKYSGKNIRSASGFFIAGNPTNFRHTSLLRVAITCLFLARQRLVKYF